MNDPAHVRKPAVAGSFYPDNAGTLRRDIAGFLSNVSGSSPGGRPLVLVEPHAGYMYSGQVAAYGYKLLQDRDINKVIVISPSHMEYFPFVSIFSGDAYETPLGRVPVDRPMGNVLASKSRLIRMSERGHIQHHLPRREHALEVQLPFLQCMLEDFEIIPIVMGDQNWEACSALGEALGPLLKEDNTLIVASSDLSHFHSYGEAETLDGVFCRLLEGMDPRKLYDSVQEDECEACGAGIVVASLIAAQRAAARTCRVLYKANSGDVTGDRSSVVGYAAAVVMNGSEPEREKSAQSEALRSMLSGEDKTFLLKLARHAIGTALGVETPAPGTPASPALEMANGVFVTLKVQGILRGCIGSIQPRKPIRETVAEMARAAAFDDPRFPSMRAEELPTVSIEISVLSPLREIDGPEDVTVGRDGLVVEQGPMRGLLLPQVAESQGWDPTTFLEHTARKAGLPESAWQDDETRTYAFTASVFAEDLP
jgi:AmmeMemoRadiSam system protein B/AmmeMemoRadiSam system protein A